MTSARDFLAQALSDRYALERELGRGAMATVYLARDLRHRRPVAIKVLHPRLTTAIDSERFLREVEIAASLSHPLIVPLYDSGNADGLLYYVMPYVEGESLYDRLQRDRTLPLDDAIRIARDVAEALGHAHNHGVLHRDVKPENILLAGGHGLIADFGLARAIGAADYQRLTLTGVVVGTPYYMSPEQILASRDLDQRTDIYGLGCILYEMLTGEPPYTGTSLSQVVKRILSAPVPSARRLSAAVPPALDRAITTALAKSAEARFATMQEFAAALTAAPVQAPPGGAPPGPTAQGGGLARVLRGLRSRLPGVLPRPERDVV